MFRSRYRVVLRHRRPVPSVHWRRSVLVESARLHLGDIYCVFLIAVGPPPPATVARPSVCKDAVVLREKLCIPRVRGCTLPASNFRNFFRLRSPFSSPVLPLQILGYAEFIFRVFFCYKQKFLLFKLSVKLPSTFRHRIYTFKFTSHVCGNSSDA